MRLMSIWVLIFSAASATAQVTYDFKTGLSVAQCHRYGREAIVTDEVAYQQATGVFQRPHAGLTLFTTDDGEQMKWTVIEVDSTGRFRGNALRNGYIYLAYQSPRAANAVLNVSGDVMCYVNGEPRGGDIYNDGWMYLPVRLQKGLNEILVRCSNFSRFQGVKAKLLFPKNNAVISTDDATLPHVIIGTSDENLLGGVVVINTSDKPLRGLSIRADVNGRAIDTPVPEIGPLTIRKVPFYFNAASLPAKGEYSCQLQLKQNARILDEQSLRITAVESDAHQSYTFISDIDGSVQYYSVAPYRGTVGQGPALFLSVHGAGVEAIGQSRAYHPKDWGVLVAPTNRRPRGFNWEDWGRIDALEVLALATNRFNPDPERIYLTGHSMGGHGTWYLGATYPDKWAAIAPCAGYPTLSAYGSADGRIPDSARSPLEKVLLRASNPSNVLALAANYKHHGVYIFHGDEDRTVPVTFARQMRDVLSKFHPDFSYYEYPGGSHWFGNESVDWPPLFEFFRWHTLKPDTTVNRIHFITANPAISSTSRWVSIIQQEHPLGFSEVNVSRDTNQGTITGTTNNVATIKLNLADFNATDKVTVSLDSQVINVSADQPALFLRREANKWVTGHKPAATEKNPLRSGTFKEAFNHRMIFVYGTIGNAEEDRWTYNKARYDAEVWYYRGNGAVDIIADNDFEPSKYPDRGVVLYGNAANNSAWTKLLGSCPIHVTRDAITFGGTTLRGNDLGAYFTWRRTDSDVASVAVVAGTGIKGLRATEANQYFAGGSGFPDYVIFSVDMLRTGVMGLKTAGFYDNSWAISPGQTGHPERANKNKIEGD